jgi:hypothetical protein
MATTTNKINIAIKMAVSRVIHYFQTDPERFWNESDIHWLLRPLHFQV